MRLLLVEDDPMLGAALKKALAASDYGVDWMQDGEAALLALEASPFAAVVLDINLPGISGLEVLATIRKQHNLTPVMLLTARDTATQKIEGLDSGADDYMVKPFDLGELLARLRALIRRSEGRSEASLHAGEVMLDPAARTVTLRGQPVSLTAKEFKTLKLLLQRAGKFVTKDEIEYALYSADEGAESNTVEVAVYHLRKKLGAELIETIRGVGYRVRKA